MFGCHRQHRWIIAAISGAAVMDACRGSVPTRAEELDEGSFTIHLSGAMVNPGRVVDELVKGTACRVGEFIRLDNRSMSRRFLIRFPTISPTAARYEFAYPQQSGAAEAHLNAGSDLKAFSSISFVNGSATIVARSPWDALGTLEAQLSQVILEVGPVGDSLTVRGAFRASRCSDWPYPQR